MMIGEDGLAQRSLAWMYTSSAMEDALKNSPATASYSRGKVVEMGSQCCLDDETTKLVRVLLRVLADFGNGKKMKFERVNEFCF